MRRLLLVLACLPFLLADSCVKTSFVMYEYALSSCPGPDFELPEAVRFAGWRLIAREGTPYCHGLFRYHIEEEREPEVFSEPVKEAIVYARVVHAKPCRLQLVSNLACDPGESVRDCEDRMPYQGVFRGVRATRAEYTGIVAQKLMAAQKYEPRLPAKVTKIVGRVDALKEWCER